MTTKKKVLLGCLTALGAMFLAVILSVFFFVTWIKSPSPELDGSRLVEPDTLLYAEIKLRREDQAVRDLLRTFVSARNKAGLEQLRATDMEGIPPFIRRFIPMFQHVDSDTVKDADLDKVLPAAAFLTSSSSDGEDLSPLLAVNFPASGNVLSLIDWLLRRTAGDGGDLQHLKHGDESIYRLRKADSGWFSIVETDVLFALDQPALIRGIETLGRIQPPPSPPALASLLAATPEDTALRMAAAGDGVDHLSGLLSPWIPGVADLLRERLAGADTITGWAHLESAQRLAGVLLAEESTATSGEKTSLSRYTLQFLDGSLSFVLEDKGLEAGGLRRWEFTLDGVDALVVMAARKVSGHDGIVIGP